MVQEFLKFLFRLFARNSHFTIYIKHLFENSLKFSRSGEFNWRQDGEFALVFEGMFSVQHDKPDQAHHPNVSLLVQHFPGCVNHFRRAVHLGGVWLNKLFDLGFPLFVDFTKVDFALNGTPQVADLVLILAVNDVLGLEVQVVEVGGVQFCESIENLEQDQTDLLGRESPVLDLCYFQLILLRRGSCARTRGGCIQWQTRGRCIWLTL